MALNLSIDIALKYGLDDRGFSAETVVSEVNVKGRNVYFKDKRLDSDDLATVIGQCQKNPEWRVNGGSLMDRVVPISYSPNNR